ncbi:MAG: hypothetical protein HC854_07680 [Flavobacterium sp.]|nr:hypothetical protein [Flavobacterium sp.]
MRNLILRRFNDTDIYFKIFEHNEIVLNKKDFSLIPDLTDKFKKNVYRYENDSNFQFFIESKSPFIQYESFKNLEDLIFFKRNCFLIKNEDSFFAYYKISDIKTEKLKNLKRIEVDFYDNDYKKELFETENKIYLLIYHFEKNLIGVNVFDNINDLNYVEPFK